MLQIVDSTDEDTDEDEEEKTHKPATIPISASALTTTTIPISTSTFTAAATATSTASTDQVPVLVPPGFVIRQGYTIEDIADIRRRNNEPDHAYASAVEHHAPVAPLSSTAAPIELHAPRKCGRFVNAARDEKLHEQHVQVQVAAAQQVPKTQQLCSKDLPPELLGDAETKQVWDEWHRVREDRKETTVWIGNIRIWYRLRPAPSKEPGDIYIKFPDRKKIRSTKELIEYLSDRLSARSTKPLPSGCSLGVMLKAFNLMEYAAKFEENGYVIHLDTCRYL